EATGAAAGNTTLQFTAIDSAPGNPPLATGVTMNGVSTAVIVNNSGTKAGFSGNITGLLNVTASTLLGFEVQLGTATQGLNTALGNLTLNPIPNNTLPFIAWMTPAAFGAAAQATVHLTGLTNAEVELNVTSGTNAYSALTVDSSGGGPNELALNTNA